MGIRILQPAQHALFLWVVALAIPLGLLADFLLPETVIRGQALGIVVPLAMSAIALALWIPFSPQVRWNRVQLAALALMIALWVAQLLLIRMDGAAIAYSTFCVPIVLVMLIGKHPSRRDVEISFLIFAFSLAAISLLSLILTYFSVGPTAFELGGTRLPILKSMFGVEGRWFGPFQNENLAGPAGALVLTTGILMKGRIRWVLIVIGLLVLMISQARNSLISMVVVGAYILLTSQRVRRTAHRRIVKWTTVAALSVATISYIAFLDPTMNGRIPIWLDFVTLWSSEPFLGVRDSGIRTYVATGGHHALVPLTHAHNTFLDILARYGVLIFAGTLVVLILTYRLCQLNARKGYRAGMSVLILLIISSLGETLFAWNYLNIQLFALILVVAISSNTTKVESFLTPTPLLR